MALATNQPVHPDRNQGELMLKTNQEQPFHAIYNYAFITDEEEGLILTDINTLADGEFRNNQLTRALTWNPDGLLDGAIHITLAGSIAYISTPKGVVIIDLSQPLKPKQIGLIKLSGVRATALQFRYLFVSDDQGVKTVDVTNPAKAVVIQNNLVALDNAQRIYLARSYAYVAAGKDGLAIIDMQNPEQLKLLQLYTGDGALSDTRDVIVASTNASAFAYVADGKAGFKLLQLTSPDSQPNFYGFNPQPKPELIAWSKTSAPMLSLSKGLDRDRGVDETGGQIAVFGRLGSRPLNQQEMHKLYIDENGKAYYVSDTPSESTEQAVESNAENSEEGVEDE